MHSLAGFNLADELISRPPYVTLTIQHRLPASSAAVSGLPGLVLSRVPTKESSSLDDSTEAQSIRLRREFILVRCRRANRCPHSMTASAGSRTATTTSLQVRTSRT